MLGMTVSTFTKLHVVLSLVGIGSGLMVVFGMLGERRRDGWTALFLASTVLTSVTGFGFPLDHLLPSHKVGIVSLVILAIVIAGRYGTRLDGSWRWIYPVGCVVALYLNVFVLVVQAFQKVPALSAMAPTRSELPFQLAQLVVLALFAGLGLAAVKRFRP